MSRGGGCTRGSGRSQPAPLDFSSPDSTRQRRYIIPLPRWLLAFFVCSSHFHCACSPKTIGNKAFRPANVLCLHQYNSNSPTVVIALKFLQRASLHTLGAASARSTTHIFAKEDHMFASALAAQAAIAAVDCREHLPYAVAFCLIGCVASLHIGPLLSVVGFDLRPTSSSSS
ncbi:hypothetical protein BHM03_00007020 [Ensete ventricosum]|nr:hypothetical protein BHM03_00007020 [Ensete ventricosum]